MLCLEPKSHCWANRRSVNSEACLGPRKTKMKPLPEEAVISRLKVYWKGYQKIGNTKGTVLFFDSLEPSSWQTTTAACILPPGIPFHHEIVSLGTKMSFVCSIVRDLQRNQRSGGTQVIGMQSLMDGIPSSYAFTLQDLGQLIPNINHSTRYLGAKKISENWKMYFLKRKL